MSPHHNPDRLPSPAPDRAVEDVLSEERAAVVDLLRPYLRHGVDCSSATTPLRDVVPPTCDCRLFHRLNAALARLSDALSQPVAQPWPADPDPLCGLCRCPEDHPYHRHDHEFARVPSLAAQPVAQPGDVADVRWALVGNCLNDFGSEGMEPPQAGHCSWCDALLALDRLSSPVAQPEGLSEDDAIAELRCRVGIARLHGEAEVTVPTLGAYALNHRLYDALGWTRNADGSLAPPLPGEPRQG